MQENLIDNKLTWIAPKIWLHANINALDKFSLKKEQFG